MKWLILIALVMLVVVFFARTASAGSLSPDEARKHLAAGAVLVDVRTPEEFRERSLPGAINLPLATVAQSITNHVPDKNRVVLLHCRSGARSGTAEKQLRAIGYTNVFNLGSLSEAEKAVRGTAP
jgi:rhodanese-related sulfurtransferase